MTESAEKEPTMEEILSSIRRIISEDDDEAPAQAAPEAEAEPEPEPQAAEDDDVLELTDAMDEESVEPAFAPEEAMDADDILVVDEDDEEPAPAPQAAPEPEIEAADIGDPEPEPEVEAAGIGDKSAVEDAPGAAAMDWSQEDAMSDNIVSDQAAAAAASAFTKLARSTRVPEGADDKSLESIVREMLRPMLKEWLDANLPGIVEKKVQQEVERLARGG